MNSDIPDFPIVSVWNREVLDLILESAVFGAANEKLAQFDSREAFFAHPCDFLDPDMCVYCFDALEAFLAGTKVARPPSPRMPPIPASPLKRHPLAASGFWRTSA